MTRRRRIAARPAPIARTAMEAGSGTLSGISRSPGFSFVFESRTSSIRPLNGEDGVDVLPIAKPAVGKLTEGKSGLRHFWVMPRFPAL